MTCLPCKARRVERLRVRCSVVCDVDIGIRKYVRVTPAEVTLIAAGDEVALSVASNTSWQVAVTE